MCIELAVYWTLPSMKVFPLSPRNEVYQDNHLNCGGWISATEAAESLFQSLLPWLALMQPWQWLLTLHSSQSSSAGELWATQGPKCGGQLPPAVQGALLHLLEEVS